MPQPAWEDLDDFFDEDDFAFPAVIALQSGAQVSLSVIYDNHYVEGEAHDAYVMDNSHPCIVCETRLVRDVRRGDSITISFPDGARRFDILTAPQSTGTGISEISLSMP